MASIQQPELNERLAAILAISQKMNSQRDLSSLLDLIAREATSLLDCERASIFLLDRERNELWSKVALGSDEILRFDARRGIAGNTALTGNTINVRDAYSDPRFYTPSTIRPATGRAPYWPSQYAISTAKSSALLRRSINGAAPSVRATRNR